MMYLEKFVTQLEMDSLNDFIEVMREPTYRRDHNDIYVLDAIVREFVPTMRAIRLRFLYKLVEIGLDSEVDW